MTSAFVKQLDLQVQQINMGAQKINALLLETLRMIFLSFQVVDKLGKVRFF